MKILTIFNFLSSQIKKHFDHIKLTAEENTIKKIERKHSYKNKTIHMNNIIANIESTINSISGNNKTQIRSKIANAIGFCGVIKRH